MNKTINVGIIGVGVVGSAVVLLLEQNREVISARAGANIVIKKGVVRDRSKTDERVKIPLTNDINDILDDDEIDIVLELMGGIDLAYEVAQKALKNKKAFVTANKAMLAYHRYDLQQIANNTPIGFEASVAGGIPIIKALRDGLSANHIIGIRGILNGTCNYILTKMANEGLNFDECLKEAQKLGYAESNPTLDISGMDSAHKLIILASIAYGVNALPEDILIEGISKINQDDIFFANEFGYIIKLLAIAKKNGDEVELRVHPVMVSKNEMIGKVSGVMNGISVIGDKVGETMYYGAGAGGNPTASAVVSDLIEIARNSSSPMLGFRKPLESGLKLKPIASIESRYYLRIKVIDKAGTLAQITSILGDNGISIKMLLQRESNDTGFATLLLSTHKSNELSIQKAIENLCTLNIIYDKPYMIRIEE
ncbi:homoserine dehydrogenase [Helicobacter sp. 16-1353]|uniref:homoserine dehydrogenase n=1 Tax=Helicobacter sp. 16-1353 TaxID=2004996 RepID=UPI000DCD36C7|nr:homoserine dehydrogenase [Helicobacter sp. 16-1353]RAX54186.1 homoserine dehydrogenase [Helicobacter sp. 16-1353]